MPRRDMVCLKCPGCLANQFGETKALVDVGNTPARLRGNRRHVVARLRRFKKALYAIASS